MNRFFRLLLESLTVTTVWRIALAALLTAIPVGAIVALATDAESPFIRVDPNLSYEDLYDRSDLDKLSLAALFILRNNIVAMAGWVVWGFVGILPGLFLLYVFGLHLGGFLVWLGLKEWRVDALAWIAPHVIPEAIAGVCAISAGAGLLIFVLRKGSRSVLSSVLRNSIGTLLLLIVAAVSESVVRAYLPSALSRVAFGCFTAAVTAAVVVVVVLGITPRKEAFRPAGRSRPFEEVDTDADAG